MPLFSVEFDDLFLFGTQGLHLDMRYEANTTAIKGTLFGGSTPGAELTESPTAPDYKEIAKVIKATTHANAYLKGAPMYEKKREVKNGLCWYMRPDVVVVPKSTEDVSKIIKICRHYKVPISVRSGGHSYICGSTREGKLIHWHEAWLLHSCVIW